ncbi:MAG: hypothetical protein ACREBU_12130 [Nitrososphaera sp.]
MNLLRYDEAIRKQIEKAQTPGDINAILERCILITDRAILANNKELETDVAHLMHLTVKRSLQLLKLRRGW